MPSYCLRHRRKEGALRAAATSARGAHEYAVADPHFRYRPTTRACSRLIVRANSR